MIPSKKKQEVPRMTFAAKVRKFFAKWPGVGDLAWGDHRSKN